MKLCTFNVNSVKARKDLVLRWLEHRGNDLDVLCFQEIKTEDGAFPAADFEALGYDLQVFGQKGYNGVAILSKVRPQSTFKGFGEAAWDAERRFIRARIKGIEVVNVYAPHGDVRGTAKFDLKLRWYDHLADYLRAHFSPGDPLLVVGDFNVARDDLDVYSPEALAETIGTTAEERQAFAALLDWGLADAFRELHPGVRQFTWWDYIGSAFRKGQGQRLDYALCTRGLLKKIGAVDVDLWPRERQTPTPSDHAPVVVDIKVR